MPEMIENYKIPYYIGHIYLRYCEFKSHPIKVLKWFIKKLKNTKDFIGYIKRVITD